MPESKECTTLRGFCDTLRRYATDPPPRRDYVLLYVIAQKYTLASIRTATEVRECWELAQIWMDLLLDVERMDAESRERRRTQCPVHAWCRFPAGHEGECRC